MKGTGSKDVTQVSTYPLQERRNKVRAEDFARAGAPQLWDRIPDILVGREFKAFAAALHAAREAHGTMLWMMGAHVIKCGLGPLFIDLMERGFVSHLATNGAAPIHDLE
ncbi:MAG: hypothetical protein HY723_01985, partial [Chloroflexi bacterium]|nr:hypothetical protein [Chloroflexota bacterium]